MHFHQFPIKTNSSITILNLVIEMADVKILLVEDDDIKAKDIECTLKLYGYEIPHVASSCKDAIEHALKIMPDLILMDIVLKENIDCIESISRIRKLNIPLIYLSTDSKERSAKKSKFTEPFGYMIKPYDSLELKYAIELALYKNKMEKELKESEKSYRELVNKSMVSIYKTNVNGDIIFANKAMADLFNFRSIESLKRKKITQLYENPEDRIKFIQKLHEENSFDHYELNMLSSTGEKINVLLSAQLNDNIIEGMIIDISERKKAEKKIQESLEEKEMLLKEIHHRVKNNLMIISSLLNLESRYIKDKASRNIFKESQNRARAMALIHEKLYQSTDLKRIDFGYYIRSLATELFHTYNTDPSYIKLKINVEDIFLDINTSIPLGLIVNELITNSLKYAFPDGKMGEINVDFHPHYGQYELTVKDNGIGFPGDIDFENTDSLGLQIVNSLTGQIDGKIQLNNSQGTEFKINFKELEI